MRKELRPAVGASVGVAIEAVIAAEVKKQVTHGMDKVVRVLINLADKLEKDLGPLNK